MFFQLLPIEHLVNAFSLHLDWILPKCIPGWSQTSFYHSLSLKFAFAMRLDNQEGQFKSNIMFPESMKRNLVSCTYYSLTLIYTILAIELTAWESILQNNVIDEIPAAQHNLLNLSLRAIANRFASLLDEDIDNPNSTPIQQSVSQQYFTCLEWFIWLWEIVLERIQAFYFNWVHRWWISDLQPWCKNYNFHSASGSPD